MIEILKAKSSKLKAISGFTLIEFLLVLGILVVLASIGIWSFVGIRNVKTLDLTTQELIANLRSIQQKAVVQEQSSKWGIRIDAADADIDFYETFSGNTYAGGAVATRMALPSRVEFIYPGQGNTKDIIFSQLTGYPNDVHTIVLALVGDSSANRTVRVITINAKGLISLDNSAMGPTAPLNLTAAGESDQIVLNWSVPEFDGGSAITNYKIYRGAYSDEETLLTTAGTGLTYADSSVSRGVQYYYKVSAVNSFAEGLLSNEASAGINRRVFITSTAYNGNLGGLSGADAKCQVRATAAGLGGATWKAWLSNSSVSAYIRLNHFSGYNLVNGTLVANSWADLTDGNIAVPINVTELGGNLSSDNFVFTNSNSDASIASGGGCYGHCCDWTSSLSGVGYYAIRGNVGDTTSWWTNRDFSSCSDNNGHIYCFEDLATTPTAPNSLSGVVGQGQVTLNWLAPSSDGGAPVTNYKIYRGTVSGGEVYLTTTGSVLTYIDDGLTNGTTYYYKVSAVNIIGEGPQGSEINKTPDFLVRVFVTSTVYNGNLGGLSGADAKCQARANAVGLGGTWKAWLSTGGTSAGSRLSHRGYFQLMNGTITASSWTDLTDGVLAGAIMLDESGSSVSDSVWTNTYSNGTSGGPTGSKDCGSWTIGSGNYGNRGMSYSGTGEWTESFWPVDCGTSLRLYCFEQIAIPDAPTGLSAVNSSGQVILNWSAPLSDGGKPITNYKIYRGTTSGGESFLTSVDDVLTYTDTSPVMGSNYYKVSAVNIVGESSLSNESSVIFSAPGAPTGLTIIPDDTQSVLSWLAPASDGGSAITNYKVYRSIVSGGEVLLESGGCASLGSVLTCTDTGLTNGTAYYYKVSAVNEIGEGSQSSEVSAVPSIAYRVFVTSTTYNGNLGGLSGADAKCQARAVAAGLGGNWKAWISGSSSEASSRLYHNTASYKLVNGTIIANNWADLTDGSLVVAINISENNTPSVGNIFTDTNLDGSISSSAFTCANWTTSAWGSTYIGNTQWTNGGWTSVATDSCANLNKLYCFEQPPIIPDAPTGLIATPGIAQMVLDWSAPASDGGSAITNYKVYRSIVSGGEVYLTTVDNVLTYTDTGLSDGTTYYYKVSAVNEIGEGVQSGEASATILSAPTAPLNLSGTSGDTQVILNWLVPASDGGSAITNYKVYRGTVSGGEILLEYGGCANLGAVLTCTDTGLTNGTTYYYKVSAVNAIGEGAQSSEASLVPSRKRVFVTNTLYNGNLGGLDGADSKCQTSANSAGLGGTWKAWMSTTAISAASRLNNTGPYQLINGTLVANSWSDLVDSTIAAAININESGSTPNGTNYSVWTNTNPDGSIHTLVADSACRNWTASYIYRVTLWGRIGQRTRTDLGWSSATSINCAQTARLYCFEQ